MNNRSKKILIIAAFALTLMQQSCFVQAQEFNPFMMPSMSMPLSIPVGQPPMGINEERFLPAGIETPEEAKKPEPKFGKKKKKKDEVAQEQVPSVEISSDHMDYSPEEDKIVASGNAMAVPEDKLSKLKADKITFYRDTNVIVAEGNVRLLKDGMVVRGSFMRVDMNRNSAFMTNPRMGNNLIKIVAREGYVYSKDMEFGKGHARAAAGVTYTLNAGHVNSGFEALDEKEMIELSKSPEYLNKERNRTFRIKAKEIIVDSGKDRNFVVMKNATIYKDKKKITTLSKMVFASDSNGTDAETSLPEIGYLRQMGLYAGPSWLLNGPRDSTIKISPIMMYSSSNGERGQGNGGVGVGALAKFRTDNNFTEVGYGSSIGKMIISGYQQFSDPRFKFNYASNAYVDDWFMGGKMPNRFGEIAFKDETKINDLGLVYAYKYSGAIASDYAAGSSGDWRMNTSGALGSLPQHQGNWSTVKLKAQGQFSRQKPIWEKKDIASLNMYGQYDVNQYGTGQTYSIVRLGPSFLFTPNDRFRFRGAYYLSGVQGESPFAWDQYYYGRHCVSVAYEYKLTKKLSIGSVNSMNLLKDNFDGSFLVENRMYLKYGPEDFKFCLSYDTVWRRSIMGINMLVGSEKSDIEFDKLKVKKYKNLKEQNDKRIQKNNEEQKKKDEQV